MATDSTPCSASQSASACSWSVVVPKPRTFGWPSALAGHRSNAPSCPRPGRPPGAEWREARWGEASPSSDCPSSWERSSRHLRAAVAPTRGGSQSMILTWESAHARPPACTSSMNDGRLGPKLSLGHAGSNGLTGYDCRGHAAPPIPHGRSSFTLERSAAGGGRPILNRIQAQPGFVYEAVRLVAEDGGLVIEAVLRPRAHRRPTCSGCTQPGRGYDTLARRRFAFVPLWEIGRAS